ncbi:MAG: sulfotransferase [Hyphomicrobiales bacterium]|nr:sulfotransferase [Hyphomicrobiales bacterium]
MHLEPERIEPAAATSPPAPNFCACGSGLRARRCCDLEPSYVAPPEARDAAERLAKKAGKALANGHLAMAERQSLEALEKAPRLCAALAILYQVRRHGGADQAALTLLQRLVALEPNNIEATQELAMLLFQKGDLAAAEHQARNAIRLAPSHPRSHNLMGMILTEAQRPHIGEHHYRRVLELSGDRDPILLANLAWNLKCQGRIAEARQLYVQSTQAAPEVFQTLFGWGQLEEADGNFAEAREKFDRAAKLRPDDPGLKVARATLLARQGKLADALCALETGKRGGGTDAGLDSNMLLEKGRILDKLARYDEAFACFDAAKSQARALTGKSYLEREARDMADRLRNFFVGERLRLFAPCTPREDRPQPIFILGFPRSGTTLMEQALSSHPRISAGDELPFINECADSIGRWFGSPLSYPEALAELWMGDNRQGLEELRDIYLRKAQLRGILEPGSAHFTDKMPLNETHLGLIACMFPRSPLIHLLRHPLDVVLSVYSHHLTHGYFCAFELETIARHYVLVMDLVHHYRAQMALRYLPVRYEDMVDDVAGNLHRILDFVGEPFDERCVNFQENRRVPHTPSYAQVTEKVYDRSRYRYRHYLKHLEPVIPILEPVMDRLGYSV